MCVCGGGVTKMSYNFLFNWNDDSGSRLVSACHVVCPFFFSATVGGMGSQIGPPQNTEAWNSFVSILYF